MTQKLACIISLVIRKKCIKPKLGFITYSTGWLKWGQKKKKNKRQCIYWTTGIHIHYCLQCKFVVYLWKTKQQSIFFYMKQIQILLLNQLIVYIRMSSQNLSQNPLTGVDIFLLKNNHISSWRRVSIFREIHIKMSGFCSERVINYKNAFSCCRETLIRKVYIYIILWKGHRNNFQTKPKKIAFWKLIHGTGSSKLQ